MERWTVWTALSAAALLSLAISGCGGEASSADEPAIEPAALESEPAAPADAGQADEGQPDLLIVSGEASMPGDDGSGACVAERTDIVTVVCVQNAGGADAGTFTVRVRHRQGGGAFDLEVEELAAGEETCLEAEGPITGRATVDVDDEVSEADELNNNFIVPLYSPPPICPITPTVGPTGTPLPPGEPTATPYPEGANVRTEVFPVYDCRYLGGTTYEWYKVRVTYVDGVAVEEEILDGPFVDDEWRGGCPPGDT